MDIQALWDDLLVSLREQFARDELDVWLSKVRPVAYEDGQLLLRVPNRYYADWIQDNYQEALRRAAADLLGHTIVFALQPADETTAELRRAGVGPEPAVGLNESMTFDSFVVGECNRFAHAASRAVSDRPSQVYNPLFVYGSTGLGKTHLMHAIGNEIRLRDPRARIVYVTAEDFTNEMITAIQYKRMDAFRGRYRREATVLLVDDIQFLSGKERTQEEFFHTFNTMQASGRQIVLTSDVPPRDIEGLEPRLRTRFEGGLLADMQPPDAETLTAILRAKASDAGVELPTDLVDAIARVAHGSIRELEGVVHQLAALQRVFDSPITLAFARQHLPKLFAPEPVQVTVPKIIEVVAKFHNLRSADITGKRRTRTLTVPRHIAMYLARKHTNMSFPELGREFGNRDHSTIQHGVKNVTRQLESNIDLASQVRIIEQNLGLRQR